MKILAFLIITSCLVLQMLVGCTSEKQSYRSELGVSLELARYRKSALKNLQYDLSFQIPAAKTDPIKCQEIIKFSLDSLSRDLEIDFNPETPVIEEIVVNNKKVRVNHENEHILISKTDLLAGLNSIKIVFNAGNTNLNRNDDFIYSLLVPERARTVFPCFDQPDMKARFKVKMEIPVGWEAVSNGPVSDSATRERVKEISFDESDTISTYLFSIVAGKFKTETRIVNGRPMNLYYRETDTAKIKNSLDTIFGLHGLAIQFLEQYTGINYPFKKLDFIAVPDFPYGGMEHAGAIDYQSAVLFLDKSANASELHERAHTIAHEVSHMWFGNLVTMKWFDDVWMKEVFANFIADKAIKAIMNDGKAPFRFLLNHAPAAYFVDRTNGANPVRQPLQNLNQAGTLYGEIIYHKAPIAVQQLEMVVGEDVFRSGLQAYLKKFSFGNANWPDLIAILDSLSQDDLQEWNEQWINRKGRPVFSYSLLAKNHQVTSLSISQQGEFGIPGIWKQEIEIVFVYPDRVMLIPVLIDSADTEVNIVKGTPVPLFILFNSGGYGYGSFPVDTAMLTKMHLLKDPLQRASAYINIYENVLNGDKVSPVELVELYATNLGSETEDMIMTRMIRQMKNIFWQFLSSSQRAEISTIIEPKLWNAISASSAAPRKRTLFELLTFISITPSSIDRIYSAWKTMKNTDGFELTEDDYIKTACELALRKPDIADSILAEQQRRITNKERKGRLAFIAPSLSKDIKIREEFFSSLLDKTNRQQTNWVVSALEYLHHPVRDTTGEKFLKRSLEALEEIQQTGGIFFPSNWLRASLNYYQTPSAAAIVQNFLDENPNYNPSLKGKLLQEADDLLRVQKIRK